jgi:large subunit ribosomal protein L20
MARVKRGKTRARSRRKLLQFSKGFRWRRKNVYRIAKEAIHDKWVYAYIGRKQKKRNMRALWNIQINAACREHGMSYSKFIHALKQNKIELDRKVLSQLARLNPEVFKELTEKAAK